LAEQGVTFQEVDISNNAALQAQFNVCVPVVVVDGRVRFRGRVNVPLLRKLLRLPHPVPKRPKLL
jgi:glutaredoxin